MTHLLCLYRFCVFFFVFLIGGSQRRPNKRGASAAVSQLLTPEALNLIQTNVLGRSLRQLVYEATVSSD
jgi:hypothetical protein